MALALANTHPLDAAESEGQPTASTVAPANLSERECEEVLQRNGIGRLACYSPSAHECYVVPVAYVWHRGAVYLALAPGQKLDYLSEHPAGICLEVEEVEGGYDWKTVLVTGDFRRIDSREHPIGRPRRGGLQTVFEIGLAPYAHEGLVLCKLEIRKVSGRHDRWALVPGSTEIARRPS